VVEEDDPHGAAVVRVDHAAAHVDGVLQRQPRPRSCNEQTGQNISSNSSRGGRRRDAEERKGKQKSLTDARVGALRDGDAEISGHQRFPTRRDHHLRRTDTSKDKQTVKPHVHIRETRAEGILEIRAAKKRVPREIVAGGEGGAAGRQDCLVGELLDLEQGRDLGDLLGRLLDGVSGGGTVGSGHGNGREAVGEGEELGLRRGGGRGE
jgi:hypothetical protein